MTVTLEAQRAAQEALLQAALTWWESQRPAGWDLRQHLDHPTVNAGGSQAERALATSVAHAVEVGTI